MNLQALGDKLQRYRIQLQRTVDEVAAFPAINVERLSSIEKGALEPTETRSSSLPTTIDATSNTLYQTSRSPMLA